MAKEMAKKAGIAALESVLTELMPQMQRTLQSVESRIGQMEQRIGGLERAVDLLRLEFKEELHEKFDQQRDVINELGQRMARVEGELSRVVVGMDRQSNRMDKQADKMDQWIERLVRLEVGHISRRRKAS